MPAADEDDVTAKASKETWLKQNKKAKADLILSIQPSTLKQSWSQYIERSGEKANVI